MARMKVKYKNGVWIVSLKSKIFEKIHTPLKEKNTHREGRG